MSNKNLLQFVVLGSLGFVVTVLGQQVFAQSNTQNISGKWIYQAKSFGPRCVINNAEPKQSLVTIEQNGTQFLAGGGISFEERGTDYEAIGNGTLVNNAIQSSTRDNYISWSGTISEDGKTISGRANCIMGVNGRGTLEFILTKTDESTTIPNTPPETSQSGQGSTPANTQIPPLSPVNPNPNQPGNSNGPRNENNGSRSSHPGASSTGSSQGASRAPVRGGW